MNKILRFRIGCTVLLLLLAAGAVAAQGAQDARVDVHWAANDKLSEVRENPFQRGILKPAQWQRTLGDFLRQRAARLLPADQRLEVTITDIKLAGDFEPWRGPQLNDVRFMRDIYPPRIDLHFRLTDASGATLREGSAKLRDLAYLQRTLPDESDPLRYDKRLLGDWLSREFRNRTK
ncbi:MAG: DUF3016 domain-containing protein [Proteobacteria bacterium]|nr:DUF3016 domain-containing protein [Pseudomonadota bacterium]